MHKEEAKQILKFWFNDSPTPTKDEKQIWFFKKYDSEITHLFLPLFQKYSSNLPQNLHTLKSFISTFTKDINIHNEEDIILSLDQYTMITFQTIIAAIILIDQMPKNMFRDRPEAFFHQNTISNFALDILQIIDPKIMSYLATPKQFFFIILCIIHQENIQNFHYVKKYLIQYFTNYYKSNPHSTAIYQQIEEPLVKSIFNHQSIIEKFGRYPKRNQALNRPSTQEEELYIQQSQNKLL